MKKNEKILFFTDLAYEYQDTCELLHYFPLIYSLNPFIST